MEQFLSIYIPFAAVSWQNKKKKKNIQHDRLINENSRTIF